MSEHVAPAGPQRDRQLAKLLGWEQRGFYWRPPNGSDRLSLLIWSTNDGAAMGLLQEALRRGYNCKVECYTATVTEANDCYAYYVEVHREGHWMDEPLGAGRADSLADAISQAVVEALLAERKAQEVEGCP